MSKDTCGSDSSTVFCKPGDLTYMPTTLDLTHAMMYAMDRVKKEKCSDPDILKLFPGIGWKSADDERIYPCPEGVSNCEHGKAIIKTQEQCEKLSTLPYDANTGGIAGGVCSEDGNICRNDDECNGAKCVPKSCDKNEDCGGLGFEAECRPKSPNSDKKQCMPKYPYLEWDKTNSKCLFGNFPLRKWCEFPEYRRQGSVNGVTNVPPFKYSVDKRKCEITKPYCDWMEVSYKVEKDGTPTCYESVGQKIAENFFFGKTIFRGLKSGFHGHKEEYKMIQDVLKTFTRKFDSLPNTIVKLADTSEMDKYEKIGDDFGGKGVHLYTIYWGKNAYKYDRGATGVTSGFLAREVVHIYPEIVKKIDGKKCIVISRKQLIERKRKGVDKRMNRIYQICGSGKWFTETLTKEVEAHI